MLEFYSDFKMTEAIEENDEYFRSGISFARHRIEDVFELYRIRKFYCPEHPVTLEELEDTLLKIIKPEIIDEYIASLNLITIEEFNNEFI